MPVELTVGRSLTVQSVAAAIGAFTAGAYPDEGLIAVGGWLELAFPLSCPFDPTNPHPALLERVCGWMYHVLSEKPQALATVIDNGNGSGTVFGRDPTGAYIEPRQGPGAAVNVAVHDHPARTGNGYDPRPAILVGHFHDARAILCPPKQQTMCDGEFVVDQVAWVDGETLGPTFFFGSYTGAPLTPRLDEPGVEAAAQTVMPASSTVVWASGLPAADLAEVDPRPMLHVPPTTAVWFVRYTTAPTGSTPAGGSGWLVLDDATGSVIASSSS